MIFRFHGFFLMLFCRRNYLEFSFSIGYDDWNKDFAVRLMAPFLLVSKSASGTKSIMVCAKCGAEIEVTVAGKAVTVTLLRVKETRRS